MFITHSVWLLLVSWSYPSFVVAIDVSDDTATARCTFAINDLRFDLCPLFVAHPTPFNVIIDEETPPTRTKNVYMMSLGGPLRRDGTLPAELQCPKGTRICLTVVNTRPNHPSEPSRVIQVIPVVGADTNVKAILGKKENEDDHHAPLQVTLHGGSYMKQNQKATFLYHCDHDAEEPTLPTYQWKWNGTHAFSWKTRHACHKPLSDPKPDPGPDPDPPQDPPKDPESDPNEEDRDRSSRSSSTLKVFWFAVLLVLTSSIAGLLFFLLLRRHQRSRLPSSIPSAITRQIQAFLSTRFIPRSLYIGKEQRVDLSSYHRAYPDINSEEDEGEEVPLTPSPSGTFSRNTRTPGYYGSF
ncbi:autophagy-related protein 27-domain-containing protein [Lyophyllum atratum]|nr:autophagy-related protein 27-domain-containing protein [Lyophyllum atratum]